jgi:hypothetical protein
MKNDIPGGAQTERRGDAGPVRLQLGGETHLPLVLLLLDAGPWAVRQIAVEQL